MSTNGLRFPLDHIDIRTEFDFDEDFPLSIIRRHEAELAEEDDFYLVGDRPRPLMSWQAIAAALGASTILGLCFYQLYRLWEVL